MKWNVLGTRKICSKYQEFRLLRGAHRGSIQAQNQSYQRQLFKRFSFTKNLLYIELISII